MQTRRRRCEEGALVAGHNDRLAAVQLQVPLSVRWSERRGVSLPSVASGQDRCAIRVLRHGRVLVGAVAARPAQEGEAITDCNREKSLRFVGVGIALLRRRSPPYALRSDRARSRRMSSVSACSRSPCPSIHASACSAAARSSHMREARSGEEEGVCMCSPTAASPRTMQAAEPDWA